MINVFEDGKEGSIVPEKPIASDDPAITSFLIPRILDKLVEKHFGFDYQFIKKEGNLKAILIREKLEDRQIKELSNAARGAFSKAMDRNKQ